jgi:PIN domain-containing protein
LKVRADEHVCERIVSAVRDIALTSKFEISSVLGDDRRGADDVHWITRFAKEGGHAILTADTDFLKRPNQVIAILDTGLKIIHLPPKWANARRELQASHILAWWRRIETTITSCKPRECWRPEWNTSEQGALHRIMIDYEKHRRKFRKAARRSIP